MSIMLRKGKRCTYLPQFALQQSPEIGTAIISVFGAKFPVRRVDVCHGVSREEAIG